MNKALMIRSTDAPDHVGTNDDLISALPVHYPPRETRSQNCPEVHISEDDLEEYLVLRLPTPENAAIELHLGQCDVCTDKLIEVAEYVLIIRTAMTDNMLQFV